MGVYVCPVCGHVEFSEVLTSCPSCQSPGENYNHDDRVLGGSREKSKAAAIRLNLPRFSGEVFHEDKQIAP
jgi:hypothetical protein